MTECCSVAVTIIVAELLVYVLIATVMTESQCCNIAAYCLTMVAELLVYTNSCD